MAAPTVVILAAGQGTRMRSSTPKVLHDLCGRPLIAWPIAAARAAGAARIIVVGSPGGALEGHLPDDVELAVQHEALGTGDAVKAAAAHVDRDGPVVVLAGDVPLVTADAIRALADAHAGNPAAATMATMELDDPDGYGRVVRDGQGDVMKVVETKSDGDATREELLIREVNTGVFCFDGGALLDALDAVTPGNAQGEYYLPDVLPILRDSGSRIAAHSFDDPSLTLGVNDRADLARVRALAQEQIITGHLRAGVTIVSPGATVIDADVEIGPDTTIELGCTLRRTTTVGTGATIGPNTTLLDTEVGDGARVIQTYAELAKIGANASVGPFAFLRPKADIGEGAKIGTFVEVKNSNIGAGAKVPHLSYIGDADVGEGSNLGAGTITANYDGHAKHRTTIGKGVRGGVDTAFIAPVTVGDGAWTAAGSVITEDVPPGALAVARSKQRNIEGYDERRSPAPAETNADRSDG